MGNTTTRDTGIARAYRIFTEGDGGVDRRAAATLTLFERGIFAGEATNKTLSRAERFLGLSMAMTKSPGPFEEDVITSFLMTKFGIPMHDGQQLGAASKFRQELLADALDTRDIGADGFEYFRDVRLEAHQIVHMAFMEGATNPAALRTLLLENNGALARQLQAAGVVGQDGIINVGKDDLHVALERVISLEGVGRSVDITIKLNGQDVTMKESQAAALVGLIMGQHAPREEQLQSAKDITRLPANDVRPGEEPRPNPVISPNNKPDKFVVASM